MFRTVDRINERELNWRAELARWLKQAQKTDREEQRRLGIDQAANQLFEELANAQQRLERLQPAKMELEQEAQGELETALENYSPRKLVRVRSRS
jgi:hypothetical protein